VKYNVIMWVVVNKSRSGDGVVSCCCTLISPPSFHKIITEGIDSTKYVSIRNFRVIILTEFFFFKERGLLVGVFGQ